MPLIIKSLFELKHSKLFENDRNFLSDQIFLCNTNKTELQGLYFTSSMLRPED